MERRRIADSGAAVHEPEMQLLWKSGQSKPEDAVEIQMHELRIRSERRSQCSNKYIGGWASRDSLWSKQNACYEARTRLW